MLKSFAQGSQTGLELELVSEAQVLLSIPSYFVFLSLFFHFVSESFGYRSGSFFSRRVLRVYCSQHSDFALKKWKP